MNCLKFAREFSSAEWEDQSSRERSRRCSCGQEERPVKMTEEEACWQSWRTHKDDGWRWPSGGCAWSNEKCQRCTRSSFGGVINESICRHHQGGWRNRRERDVFEEWENVSRLFIEIKDVVAVDELGVVAGRIFLTFVCSRSFEAYCWKRQWLLEEQRENNGLLK